MSGFVLFFCLLIHSIFAPCPDGTVDDYQEMCLVPHNKTFTFAQAQLLCNQTQGTVVPIDNVFTNRLTQRLADQDFQNNTFIDAFRGPNGNWTYTSGRQLIYLSWATGEPKNGLNCAYMDHVSGNWYATDCSTTMLPVVCGVPEDVFIPTTIPTTAFVPRKCFFCYPGADNILFILDVSMNNKYWKQVVKGLSEVAGNWSGFDRIAVLGYGDLIFDVCRYRTLITVLEFENVLDAMGPRDKHPPSIATALMDAQTFVPPNMLYTGKQTTILISAVGDPDDIQEAKPYAKILQDQGALIVVSLNYQVDALSTLTSPGWAMNWNNVYDSRPLRDFLDNLLSQ
ncbi:unnamed protein product, partial [Mesorhabditis belari]|uniref:C-type lectin domain-containing protein n=1 Tax=Mesorhabditis belari TaxID=2138241 RepID=A0AAF3FC90_9BILA